MAARLFIQADDLSLAPAARVQIEEQLPKLPARS